MAIYVELILSLVIVVFAIYEFVQRSFRFWENKKVPFIKPTFPYGSSKDLLNDKRGLNQTIWDFYNDFKSKGYKYGGFYIFTSPKLLVVNPDVIKTILTKDFQYFASHGLVYDLKHDPLSGHLFNLEGQHWKTMRAKLTPTFTSGKMKMMFQTLVTCGIQMQNHIDNLIREDQHLDIKEILACYTTDIIGSCAFGLDCNSFKDPNAEFRQTGRNIFKPRLSSKVRRFLGSVSPRLVKLLRLTMLSKETSQFFLDAVKNIDNYRQSNNIQRNDFIQLLLNLKRSAKDTNLDGLTLEEMAAQSFVFFVAGFETSSTTMTFCLYELVQNQDIQDKLREEVRDVLKKHSGQLSYEALNEMKYMDNVINETLRKYPPVSVLQRMCTQDYQFSDSMSIKKGTEVMISTLGMHRDEEYYPNPDVFDPDRFNEGHNRHPFVFLPFGEGPRACIGLRFGLMQTKAGLAILLSNYKLYPHKSLQFPIDFDPKSFILGLRKPLLLTAEKINQA